MNMAGTTALMGIIDGARLIVANVGDSRGVMCDIKGNAIPLSFDHKPQQVNNIRNFIYLLLLVVNNLKTLNITQLICFIMQFKIKTN